MWLYYNTARKGFKTHGKTKARQEMSLCDTV